MPAASIKTKNPPSLDAGFSGGNILVESAGEVCRLHPDLRDTCTPWFYWCFRVKGAAGETLKFAFDPENIGVRGPAVSLDEGRTWSWTGAGSVKAGAFSFVVPEGISDVRFSMGMPYARANWDGFLAAHRDASFFSLQTLAKTGKGREVPLVLAGNPKAPFAVAITGRHHACEMMASYALEGAVEEIIGGGATWLRENVSFWIVPFVDLDGVESGDQGKNRAPHDHNRDYQDAPIYPETRAIKEGLPAWLDGRPFAAFDFHCPALSGPVHESIFFIEPEDRIQAGRLDQFCACLQSRQGASGLFQPPHKLAFGAGFNTADRRRFTDWSGSLPNAFMSTGLEVAYANASGSEVNARSSRQLGRDFAGALQDWLKYTFKNKL